MTRIFCGIKEFVTFFQSRLREGVQRKKTFCAFVKMVNQKDSQLVNVTFSVYFSPYKVLNIHTHQLYVPSLHNKHVWKVFPGEVFAGFFKVYIKACE